MSHIPGKNRHSSHAPRIQCAGVEVDPHDGVFPPQKVLHQSGNVITQSHKDHVDRCRFHSHGVSGDTLAKHRTAAKQGAARDLAKLLYRCPVPSERHFERHIRYGGGVFAVGKYLSVIQKLFLGGVTKKVIRAARTDVLVSDSR